MPEVSADSLIPLSNEKAKAIFRQWEEDRIRAFRKWMKAGGNPLKGYKIAQKTKWRKAMSDSDLPDIINIHTLERMALAEAAGIDYDPTTDPDSPMYISPEEPDDDDEDDILDLTGVVFEKVSEAPPTPTHPPKPSRNTTPPKTAPAERDEPRPLTTPELDDALAAELMKPQPAGIDDLEDVVEEAPEVTEENINPETTVPDANNASEAAPQPPVVAEEIPEVKPDPTPLSVAEAPQGAPPAASAQQPVKSPRQMQLEKQMEAIAQKKKKQQEEADQYIGKAYTPPKKSKQEKLTTKLESGNHKKLSDLASNAPTEEGEKQ